MIKAFLFDFDGVIADTEVPTFESWRQVYADYGVELALEDWLPAVGSGSSTSGAFDAVAHLERLLARPVDREARHRTSDETQGRALRVRSTPSRCVGDARARSRAWHQDCGSDTESRRAGYAPLRPSWPSPPLGRTHLCE